MDIYMLVSLHRGEHYPSEQRCELVATSMLHTNHTDTSYKLPTSTENIEGVSYNLPIGPYEQPNTSYKLPSVQYNT